jgi:tetratricopeptide (TPR) repeat protein
MLISINLKLTPTCFKLVEINKIITLLLIVILLFPTFGMAQTKIPDSLRQVLDASTGSERISLLNRLAVENQDDDPLMSLSLAIEAIKIARAEKLSILLSDALKIQADALYNLDSIKPATFAYLRAVEIEEALPKPRPDILMRRLGDVGFCYQDMGLFDKALIYFERALAMSRTLGDTIETASNLSNIGFSLKMLGCYGEAIDAFNQTLELDRITGSETELATDYNNIGMVYRAWLQYDLAVEFFEKALEIDERLANHHKLSTRYSNIGQVYLAWDKIPEAIGYFNKALEIDREMEASGKIALRLHGLGLAYMSLKEYQKAIEYFNEAQQTFQLLNHDFQTAIVMEHTGDAYIAMNDIKNAEYYYQQSLGLSQQLGLKPTTIEAAKGLYKLHKNQGDYQKSLKYFEVYKVAEDSVFSETSARQINEFEIRYETEMKENENRLLTKDVQLLTKDVKLKTRNQWFFGTVILALIMVSLALLYAFGLKRKSLLQSQILFDKESELNKLKINQVEKQNRHLKEVLFAEEEIKRLQARSIEQKNHELTSATLLIANKNEAFDKIKKLAEQHCTSTSRDMIREIERQTDLESQWEQFKMHFESIHKSFFATLRDINSGLTQTDMQLCAYIKLNLSTKEIARLMNIAPESVNTHRYRLRKKLALPAEETLDGFVHGL